MKLPPSLFALLVGLCAVAQQATEPQVKLRILVDKEDYSLKEKVTVRAELTNITSKTLCFPVPAQDCEAVATGFVVTTGEPVSTHGDQFICHTDGGGAVGAELDSEIKQRWIKLSPKAVYVTNAAEAKVTLNELGNWRLAASYHPPEGSFSAKYRTILQTAARRAGCELPLSVAEAEPKIITVRN
jgi:hypothetical protein